MNIVNIYTTSSIPLLKLGFAKISKQGFLFSRKFYMLIVIKDPYVERFEDQTKSAAVIPYLTSKISMDEGMVRKFIREHNGKIKRKHIEFKTEKDVEAAIVDIFMYLKKMHEDPFGAMEDRLWAAW